MITRDPLGTWETLSSPSSKAAGDTAYQLQNDPRPRVPDRGGHSRDAAMVSPSEGNEVRRDGRQGVGALRSSREAGERALPDPVERRGCRVAGPEAGTTTRASNLIRCHREVTGSCEGQRIRDVTSPTRVIRTSDLWEPWGVIPRATRPQECIN